LTPRAIGALPFALAISLVPLQAGRAQDAGDSRLVSAMSLDVPTNGVSMTPDGRRFLVLARIDGSDGPRVVEWKSGQLEPYPNAEWNSWSKEKDAARSFVRINAQRIGPDGYLWLVDVGAPSIGAKTLPGGPKLIQIDIGKNMVSRVYPLDKVSKADSFVDDVRFKGRTAYLTDAGAPGLIILNLDTGEGRRVLDDDKSVTAQKPLVAEGKEMHGPDGKPIYIHADQLEISPDGRYLYYQPCSGPLYRIETRFLDNAGLNDAELATHVEKFADTPSTGGTAIDAAGNLYVSDTDRLRVVKITPSGEASTLVQDPRLLWVDAMWIDGQGRLWMPAAQLNRLAPFQGGASKIELPVHVFTLEIGQKPPANDHQ